MYYSQYQQDAFVDEYFNKMENGIFLDIGAHDGKFLSNTYFFEKERNWRGICVEPNPRIFKLLQENRNCICIEGAVASKEIAFDFLDIEGLEVLGGIASKYHKKHKERIPKEMAFYGTKASGLIKVNGININKVLIENNITQIDYCSLDTEGNELEILKTIDFDRVEINLISVEVNYLPTRRILQWWQNITKNSVHGFLVSKGYKKIKKMHCDFIYVKG